MVLVGNKINRKDEWYEYEFKCNYFCLQTNLFMFRIVSTEDGRSLARAWNVHFIEVSVMDLEVKYCCYF